jgi:predicted RNA-binding Zn-ribbon protein involved in translation (DUF1610 family)
MRKCFVPATLYVATFLCARLPLVAQETRTEENEHLYWYCPKCGFEMPVQPWQRKRWIPCPNCGKDGRFLEVRNYSSHQFDDVSDSRSRIFILVGAGLLVGVASGYWVWRRRAARTLPGKPS